MKIANLGLWVSCLVLAASVASCSGGTTGSPIQDDLNAPETTQADPLASYPVVWDGGATSEDEAARGVSYTAGMPVPLVAGVGFPSILGYGWKGGTVTEGAAPDWVKINCASKGKSAFIIYDMKEAVPGRLKNIRVMGDGTGMSVSMSTGARVCGLALAATTLTPARPISRWRSSMPPRARPMWPCRSR